MAQAVISADLRKNQFSHILKTMSTKFVTNNKGKKIAAIVPIREYEDLLQDIYSAAIIERRKKEKKFPWEDLKKKLIADGILPN